MFKFGQEIDKRVELLVEMLPKGGGVLDIGCGRGGNSIFLADKGFDVTCADSDKEVIEEIKKIHPQINAINQDILEFNFLEEKYDLILALNVLNFFDLENIKEIIQRIIKSLKKDGLFYMQAFSINDPLYNKLLETREKRGGENTFFKENIILQLEELTVNDNHPPTGEHKHGVINVLVKKRSG